MNWEVVYLLYYLNGYDNPKENATAAGVRLLV